MAAAINDFVDAITLADEYDSTGRRLTAVDALIRETIEGDARLAGLDAEACNAAAVAWEEIARDLARQVIDAEAEIAELDEKIEDYEDAVSGPVVATKDDPNLASVTTNRDFWVGRAVDLGRELHEEDQAHCDTYVEALRLTAELAGWQESDGAAYRKATAAARLANYTGPSPVRWKSGQGGAPDPGAGF